METINAIMALKMGMDPVMPFESIAQAIRNRTPESKKRLLHILTEQVELRESQVRVIKTAISRLEVESD
jgi:hypothetical protein